MPWIIASAGLASVVVATLGIRKARRARITGTVPILIWICAALLGCAGGLMGGYTLDSRTRIYGFPFPSAVFQRDEGGHWLDYVGPLTLPFTVLNAGVGIGVALYIATTALSWNKRKATPTPTGSAGAEHTSGPTG